MDCAGRCQGCVHCSPSTPCGKESEIQAEWDKEYRRRENEVEESMRGRACIIEAWA